MSTNTVLTTIPPGATRCLDGPAAGMVVTNKSDKPITVLVALMPGGGECDGLGLQEVDAGVLWPGGEAAECEPVTAAPAAPAEMVKPDRVFQTAGRTSRNGITYTADELKKWAEKWAGGSVTYEDFGTISKVRLTDTGITAELNAMPTRKNNPPELPPKLRETLRNGAVSAGVPCVAVWDGKNTTFLRSDSNTKAGDVFLAAYDSAGRELSEDEFRRAAAELRDGEKHGRVCNVSPLSDEELAGLQDYARSNNTPCIAVWFGCDPAPTFYRLENYKPHPADDLTMLAACDANGNSMDTMEFAGMAAAYRREKAVLDALCKPDAVSVLDAVQGTVADAIDKYCAAAGIPCVVESQGMITRDDVAAAYRQLMNVTNLAVTDEAMNKAVDRLNAKKTQKPPATLPTALPALPPVNESLRKGCKKRAVAEGIPVAVFFKPDTNCPGIGLTNVLSARWCYPKEGFQFLYASDERGREMTEDQFLAAVRRLYWTDSETANAQKLTALEQPTPIKRDGWQDAAARLNAMLDGTEAAETPTKPAAPTAQNAPAVDPVWAGYLDDTFTAASGLDNGQNDKPAGEGAETTKKINFREFL